MNEEIICEIPHSTKHWLSKLQPDRPIVLLLRHSVRPYLAEGDSGYALPLTDDGVRLAKALGSQLGTALRSLHSSPLVRCVQTAEALRAGADRDLSIARDRLLGDPGVFVMDGELSGPVWRSLGHEKVMEHLVGVDEPLLGMAAPDSAARLLVQHMLARATEPGYHVFVTHDSLVTATAARLLGQRLTRDAWPKYLEAAFFWRTGDDVCVGYRASEARRTAPLCMFDEQDVTEFARRELHALVGRQCVARFFFAGGAFKTLLTGRAPKDFDLWAASDEDRLSLIETLRVRGARPLESRPYTEAFAMGERVIEVSLKSVPTTLEERLGQFDLALSAVGAEHRANGTLRAIVHPLARSCVERKEVLLLKPLVNWRHALATLQRLRRYGTELGFYIGPEEEEEIWRVFAAQSRETQLTMVERFERSGSPDPAIRASAMERLRE